jgi:hypothetical protein
MSKMALRKRLFIISFSGSLDSSVSIGTSGIAKVKELDMTPKQW